MVFEDIILKVVNTLKLYERGFTRVKRTPVEYGVRPVSLSEYIECRLNFESFKDPYLRKYEEAYDGHLFIVKSIEGEKKGNRFDSVIIEVNNNNGMSDEEFENMMEAIMEHTGGRMFSFSSNRDNLNLEIIE